MLFFGGLSVCQQHVFSLAAVASLHPIERVPGGGEGGDERQTETDKNAKSRDGGGRGRER